MAKKSKLSFNDLPDGWEFNIFPPITDAARAKGITKRGPTFWQRKLFSWEFPWEDRLLHKDNLHTHYRDVVLAYGGRGSGKSCLNVALNLFFLTTFPGCRTICGAHRYVDIEEIIFPIFKSILSIESDWDHPIVSHVPNKQDKYLSLRIPVEQDGKIIYKTSTAHFTHFSEWNRLRGKTYSYAGLEEISQLEDPIVFDEIERSLRESIAPFRMMYAASNPPESMSHWLYQKFDLSPYMKDYQGDVPDPILCKCQFCQECLNQNKGEYPYGNDGYCTNPECAFLDLCRKENIPLSREKRPSYNIDFGHKSCRGKELFCPGNQPFRRVIHSVTSDNPHIAGELVQSLKAGQDETNFAIFTMGEVRALNSNKIYPSYAFGMNTYQKEAIVADPAKDLIWSHDFNVRPRCSVIIQEIHEENDIIVDVLNEIARYDAKVLKSKFTRKDLEDKNITILKEDESYWTTKSCGPEHVAEDFIKLYQHWNQESIKLGEQKSVLIYGDHTALNSKSSPFSANDFQIMHDMLVEAGFKVQVCIRKVKGKTQVTQEDRITLTNWMLRDNKGKARIRINRSTCKHLIKSLEDLESKMTIAGKREIDKSCDDRAFKATNTNIVHLVSHISDALGYYLIRCFNLTEDNGQINFAYIAGGSLVSIDFATGTLKEYLPRPTDNSQPVILPAKSLDDINKMNDEQYMEMIRQHFSPSQEENDPIANFQEYFGYW